MDVKDLLAQGDIAGAVTTLRKAVGAMFKPTNCPECNAPTETLLKSGHEVGECPKCGCSWGKRFVGPVSPLVKSGRDQTGAPVSYSKGRPEVEGALWALWRTSGGKAVDAYDINTYSATGFIKKSLLEKLGLPLPTFEETLAKTEDVKKTEAPWGGLSKAKVLAIMQDLFEKNEEPHLGLRHAITKFDQFGVLDERILKTVLLKAGIDPDSLAKASHATGDNSKDVKVLEDQEAFHDKILDPSKDTRPGASRLGAQQSPEGPTEGRHAPGAIERLVHDNPANGEGEGINRVGKSAGTPAKAPLEKGSDQEVAIADAQKSIEQVLDIVKAVAYHAPNTPHLGKHFIFSAEHPAYPDKVKEHMSHDQVVRGLQHMNMHAHEARGKYGREERSIIVHEPNESDLQHLHRLASNLGQESAIESDGDNHRMYYYHGPHAGKYHEGHGTQWFNGQPNDHYTEVSDNQGRRHYFQHQFDWSNLKSPGSGAEPPKESTAKALSLPKPGTAIRGAPGGASGGFGIDKPAAAAPRGAPGGATGGFGLDSPAPKPNAYTAPGGLTGGHAQAKALGVQKPKAIGGPGIGKADTDANIQREEHSVIGQLKSLVNKLDALESEEDGASDKSMAPSPSAHKEPDALMKPKAQLAGTGAVGDGEDNFIGKVGIPGAPKPAVRPTGAGAAPKGGPKPAASAKAITTSVKPTMGKAENDFKSRSASGRTAEQLLFEDAEPKPLHPSDVKSKPKVVMSITPKHPKDDRRPGDPMYEKYPETKKSEISKTKRMKKSEAMSMIEGKLQDLRKSAWTPTTNTMLRKWAELGARIALEKGEDVSLTELE